MPVLVTGESGSGKELTAFAIHKNSARADGPFVAVNCGALPGSLIQAELFGYEKGAFTGATQRKIGFLERANGGTLFLDEIGDLSLELQVNLLRFLQQKTLYRVGGQEEIHLDVRVISATHIDLEQAVQQGRFRRDLYYRLNGLRLHLPALRERSEDIELLAHYFFEEALKQRKDHNVKGFSRRALQALNNYPWPGNVRELKHRIESAVVMCETRLVTPSDLALEEYTTCPCQINLREARDRAEKEMIELVLRQKKYCISETARALEVSHVTLYRLIKKYEISIQR
jgi:transcriptional regulator with PAS, ATPase and Fis domain